MIQAISDAVDKVKSSHCNDGEGRVCSFYKVSDNTGAKVFETYGIAHINMKSQIALHKLGIAPEVRSDVIEFNNGEYSNSRFMYLTELAVTVQTIVEEEYLEVDQCENQCGDCEECMDIYEYYRDHERFHAIGELQDRMKNEFKLNDTDDHWANYGFLADDTPVVVDCEFYHIYHSELMS